MPNTLTKREIQCVRLAGEGLSDKEIARRLGISPKTASAHLSNAYAKIKTPNRLEAAAVVARLYPDSARFIPIPIEPFDPPGSMDGDQGRDTAGPTPSVTWPLGPPPSNRWARIAAGLSVSAIVVVLLLGIAIAVWAVLRLTAPIAPSDALVAIDPNQGTIMSTINPTATDIALRINASERAIDTAVLQASELVQAIVSGRRKMRLGADYGHDEIAMSVTAMQSLVMARGQIVQAHKGLADLADDLKIGWSMDGSWEQKKDTGGRVTPFVQAA